MKTLQQLVFCSCFYGRPVLPSPEFAVSLSTMVTVAMVVHYKQRQLSLCATTHEAKSMVLLAVNSKYLKEFE